MSSRNKPIERDDNGQLVFSQGLPWEATTERARMDYTEPRRLAAERLKLAADARVLAEREAALRAGSVSSKGPQARHEPVKERHEHLDKLRVKYPEAAWPELHRRMIETVPWTMYADKTKKRSVSWQTLRDTYTKSKRQSR